jgi:hypothetical protein
VFLDIHGQSLRTLQVELDSSRQVLRGLIRSSCKCLQYCFRSLLQQQAGKGASTMQHAIPRLLTLLLRLPAACCCPCSYSSKHHCSSPSSSNISSASIQACTQHELASQQQVPVGRCWQSFGQNGQHQRRQQQQQCCTCATGRASSSAGAKDNGLWYEQVRCCLFCLLINNDIVSRLLITCYKTHLHCH